MNDTLQTETPAAGRAENTRFVTPEVNIYETKDGYTIEAEMPGVTKDGVEITLDDGEIAIVGRRQAEVVAGEELLRERHRSDYRRVFELDHTIDTTRIGARMNQGLLFVTLPKLEQVKARKITVGE